MSGSSDRRRNPFKSPFKSPFKRKVLCKVNNAQEFHLQDC